MSITSVVNDTVTSVSVLNAQKPLPPTITNYSVGGLDDTALDPAGGQTVQINGTGFLPGATITFDGSAVAVVTYVSPNQLTFTSPAKSAGTYTIYVVNADGGTAIYIPGIIYSVLPTWTTGAGTLGSYYETQSISNTVVASGDAPITYSLYSGSLPTGASLAANGVITGTAPVDSSSTTYSFTIQATDAQLQDSTRSFSLTINTDVVTWVSPANATTYTSAVDTAIANVTLSATDAAGYAVTYSANALPTGLTLTGANIAGTPTVIADSSTLLTATAATTNRSATRTINWSITVANDPYFEYNTLLIPGASTTFVDDASTNNFAVSIFGDTKPNNSNPYTPGYYSNFFQAGAGYTSGNGLSVAANSAFAFGTGDFTVEFWTRPPAFGDGNSTAPTMVAVHNGATDSGWQLYWNSLAIGIRTYYSNVVYWNADMTPYLNQWSHIAYVRYNGTQKIYVNGVEKCSTAAVWNWTDNIVGIAQTAQYYTGNISNLRMIKGTALYTSSFTPPTGPLTAVSGTSLLTCQSNRFIDNSTNNFTITLVNSPTISSAQPFTPNTSYSTYGSGYFDGTGDYLTVPNNTSLGMGSGNFTVEFWVYQTSLVSYRQILDVVDGNSVGRLILWVDSAGTLYNLGQNGNARNTTAAGAITTNTWIHVALVRSSGTTKFYINGTQSGSNYTDSTNYTCTTGSVYIGINSDGGTYPYQGYLTDFRMVKGTAVYTTAFTPPTQPLTAIANTSLLTLQNNQSVNNSVFLDNSTNNFLVTRNGNTTQGTFSPYGGNYSNYFDGSGDYLTTTYNTTSFDWWTTDYTIETWVYPTTYSGWSYSEGPNVKGVIGNNVHNTTTNYWSFGLGSSGNLIFSYFNGGSQAGASTTTATLNQWNHIAVVKNSSGIILYVNGTGTNIGAVVGTPQSSSGTPFTIGAGGGAYINGYISNIRIVKGTAVYTSNFTPSTTPLTPITGTSLLTCQSNRLIDNSINNFTITKNGDTSVQRFSPFNPSSLTPTSYSGYFDGSGDYLSVANNTATNLGTGDFTIEFWLNANATQPGSNPRLLSTDAWNTSAGYDIDIEGSLIQFRSGGGVSKSCSFTTSDYSVWNHIAFSRSGTTFRVFKNGVLANTYTDSSNLTSANPTYIAKYAVATGSDFAGYMSNIRIVKGTAVYTSNFTPSTTPLTAISGTSLLTLQSTTFIDNSTNNFTITAAGDTKPSTQNPFGYTSATTNGYTTSTIGGSGYFDRSASNQYLTLPDSTFWALGTTATIELWYYPVQSPDISRLISIPGVASGAAIDIYDTAGQIGAFNQGYGPAIKINQWTHIAVVLISGTWSLYYNGVKQTLTGGNTGCNITSTGNLWIGAISQYGQYTGGYLSDIRITKGSAVYTSNFVPPSSPLPATQNTVALLNMTSAGIYDAAMMNDMQTIGDAKLSTAVTKFGGSSMSFDGSGDYLSTYNPSYSLSVGSGDYTFECWLYVNSMPSVVTALYHLKNDSALASTVFILELTPAGAISLSTGSALITSGTNGKVTTGSWIHFAFVRTSGVFKTFFNGIQDISTANTTTYNGTYLQIGAWRYSTYDYSLNGYIDDLRITKGYARYTANFTPPTSAFPVY